MDFRKLIEADMTDAEGSERILTGSLPFSQLSVPRHIDLAGNNLYWYDDPLDDYKRDSANDTGALNAFVRIKNSDDILRFARRYGPLGLCKHGYPPMHRLKNGERRWCAPCGNEPINRWFYYMHKASECLDFAAQMKVRPDKITIPAKVIKRIALNSPKLSEVPVNVPVRGLGKWLVTDSVNEWLGDAGIRLELNWDKESILTLSGGSVFGALGVQLLSAVTTNNLAVCSGCGEPYRREGHKPQAGRRNFCRACGDKVANRLRVREWRATKQKGG